MVCGQRSLTLGTPAHIRTHTGVDARLWCCGLCPFSLPRVSVSAGVTEQEFVEFVTGCGLATDAAAAVCAFNAAMPTHRDVTPDPRALR